MVYRCCFALLALVGVSSQPLTSKMVVHIPESLKGEYDHREAMFGMPFYGGSIAQNVLFIDDTLCAPSFNPMKIYPRTNEPMDPPFIMMVNRGECTFVTKVRNAQRNGAAAVLVADTTCVCKDTECVQQYDFAQNCEEQEPTMADDGSGGDVSIPSFLLFKPDADKIKEQLKNGRPVQVEMSWRLPTPDDRVEYSVWSTPTDFMSKEFLRRFKNVAIGLGKRARFTPHMYIYDGRNAGCVGEESACSTLCTNEGRYCATDPDNDLNSGISGADVVTESLRRLCIWHEWGESDGVGERWWKYIELFSDRCHSFTQFKSLDCVNDVMKKAGINPDVIKSCMRTSGGLDQNSPNAFLELELQSRSDKGIYILPTVTVNNVPLRGALTSTNVFDAICSGYAPGTIPEVCMHCLGCPDVPSCVANGQCFGVSTSSSRVAPRTVSKGKISTPTFVFSLFFVMGIFGGVGFWYYKRSQEEMKDQVRGILAEYMPLEDQDAIGGGAPAGGNFAQPPNGGFVNPMAESVKDFTSQFASS